jgi:predicted O-methyltransferase YrrM
VKVLILLLCILHALSRPGEFPCTSGEFPCTSGETIESCAAPDDQVVLNTAFFRDLYSQHIDVIKEVRERMIQRKNMTDVGIIEFDPQFDDTEAEILMLLLLFAQPRKVIEFSPCGGWSTSIILDTLQRSVREGLPAHVSSYDLNSQSSVNVKSPDPDSNVEWQLHLGDVAKEYSKWRHDFYVLDYLFIDSDHSAQFTVDYINNLLNPLLSYVRQRKGKKVFVSVRASLSRSNASSRSFVSPFT